MIRFRRRLRLFVAVGVVVALVVTLGGWVGWGAVGVRDDLTAVRALLQRMTVELQAGDVAAARRTVAVLQRRTRAAAGTALSSVPHIS